MENSTKIFCIGYNKAGTTSLYHAILELGFKGCDLQHGEFLLWDILNNDWSKLEDFCKTAEVFKDIPFSLPNVWKKVYQMYPNAKYILSERDSTEQWYNSITKFHKKVFNLSSDPSWKEVQNIEYRYIRNDGNGGCISDYLTYIHDEHTEKPYDKTSLHKSYESHNKEVKEFFKDKDNFISVNIANNDDYIKLRKFLNKPIGFPHLMKT